MSTAVLVQRAPGDELVRLTAELYELVRSAELLHSHPDLQARYDKLRAWATDLAGRFERSRIDMAERFEQSRVDMAERFEQSRVDMAERFEQSRIDMADRFERSRLEMADDVANAIDEAVNNLKAYGRELSDKPRARELRQRWKSLTRDYEAMFAHVRELRLKIPKGTRLAHIKPRNYARNIFHLVNGLVGVLFYELVDDKTLVLFVGSLLLTTFLSMDLLRRISPHINKTWVEGTFGKISRPGEAHRIPAATWFLGALVLGVMTLPQHAIELGAVVLAVGDPVASLVGKRWGKRKLIGEKSVAGTIAFTISAALAGLFFLLLVRSSMGFAAMAQVAVFAALAGALAEVSCERFDDNATVPLLAGGVAALLLM